MPQMISLSQIFASSSPAFVAFFGTMFPWGIFLIQIWVGIFLILLLIYGVERGITELRYKYSSNFRYQMGRDAAIDRLRENRAIDRDFDLWRKSQ